MPAPARTDDDARALLDRELAHLAPRREALGEAGTFAVAGRLLQQALEWEAAALAWRRASETDARDVNAVFGEGLCLLELGRWDEAAALFRRALELDREVARLDWFDEDPAFRLGNALHAKGDLEAAALAYEESVRRNLLGVDALRELARCRLAQGRPEDALAVLDRLERRAVRLSVRAEVQAMRAEAGAMLRRGA